MIQALSTKYNYKSLLPEDIKGYSPKKFTKLPITFWEDAPIETIISISTVQLDELDITKLAEIFNVLKNRNINNTNDKANLVKFIELFPGSNIINQLEIEANSETIAEINNMTAKEIKKYNSKEIAELPIYFWKYISFDAINKISKTQLRDLDKIYLDQIRKIIYSRFSDLKSKDYYSLINRIQFTLMVLRRTSAQNIFIDNIEYISMYRFYNLLRYSTVPQYSIIQRIEENLEIYMNLENETKYYSIKSCVNVLNNFYLGPEKKQLSELPDEFLTIKEAMGILGFSERGRETLNARIGCYKIGRIEEDIEESEHPNKAKRTLFLLEDVKKYAYKSNSSGMLRIGILEEEQVDYLLKKRYSDIKDN